MLSWKSWKIGNSFWQWFWYVFIDYLLLFTLGCIIVDPLFRFCRKNFEILPKFWSKISHILQNIYPWSFKIVWLNLPDQKKHFKTYIYPSLIKFKKFDLRFSTPFLIHPPFYYTPESILFMSGLNHLQL